MEWPGIVRAEKLDLNIRIGLSVYDCGITTRNLDLYFHIERMRSISRTGAMALGLFWLDAIPRHAGHVF